MFASLVASAFLIYLDPNHHTNRVRTLVFAQSVAAVAGLIVSTGLGLGYIAAGVAMAATTVLMVTFNVMHPPAIATALSFAFRDAAERSLLLFVLALALIAVLVLLQRSAVWLLLRLSRDIARPHRGSHATGAGLKRRRLTSLGRRRQSPR